MAAILPQRPRPQVPDGRPPLDRPDRGVRERVALTCDSDQKACHSRRRRPGARHQQRHRRRDHPRPARRRRGPRHPRRLRVDHAGRHRSRHAARRSTQVSRIHFRGGSYLGISRANPTTSPSCSRTTVIVAAAARRRRMLITIGGDDTAFSAMKLEQKAARPHPRRPRAEDDRQRPRPAAARRHLRLPDRAALRRRDRQEPDGRREDDVALVLRHRDGPQGRPPRARHRQGRGRDADADPGGVRRAARSGSRRSSTRWSARSSSASATAGATASR